jgi:hypothetical protein
MILSSIRFAEWAKPHKNIPSVAKSTGRSFICASRKNPSVVSGTFKNLAIDSFSSPGTIPADSINRSVDISMGILKTWSKISTCSPFPFFETTGFLSSSYLIKTTSFSLAFV